MENQKFQALSKLLLNNWHYIERKVLTFSEGINFFTGHSGSGKSTVIDAMQILLYANTDGRGFFNKAAADDSDRTLMEYLRGMVNIGEDNQFTYLRNRNFSTTIVMELTRSDTGESQSIGVVFDVDTAANQADKRFFWHRGPLLDNGYRTEDRAMSMDELKKYLAAHLRKDEYYFATTNERFRKRLYETYLGNLNAERFPLLFKRAIPFRMNIKLEDFVKQYICTEQEIYIEDMQESVMQYGRMRKRIADTCGEIEELKKIQKAHLAVTAKEKEKRQQLYFMEACGVKKLRVQADAQAGRLKLWRQDLEDQKKRLESEERQLKELEAEVREIIRLIAESGYEGLKTQLSGLNEMIERLSVSLGKWQRTADGLKKWEEQDSTYNKILQNIPRFAKHSISTDKLRELQAAIREMRKEAEEQKKDAEGELRDINRQERALKNELRELKQGRKAYPKEVEEARVYIRNGLKEQNGRVIPVEILADLLEIRDDTWRNAVEGYLGNNKLLLIVEPKYVRAAMELYQELDKEKYCRVSVLDTEKVQEKKWRVQENALAEEVLAKEPYVRAYLDYLLGAVIKCENVEELRRQNTGITRECLQYRGFKLQHLNPELYTRRAYIGAVSVKNRIRQAEAQLEELQKRQEPYRRQKAESETLLSLEYLPLEAEEYLFWQRDIEALPQREKEKSRLVAKLKELEKKDIDQWNARKTELELLEERKKVSRDKQFQALKDIELNLKKGEQEYHRLCEELEEKEKVFRQDAAMQQKAEEYFSAKENPNYERLEAYFLGEANKMAAEIETAMSALRETRYSYLRKYPNRTSLSPEDKDNRAYEELMSRLQYRDLGEMRQKADEQAREAVQLFKQDFIYKIRSAIKAAYVQRDELNQIISRMDFGKDKYRFIVGKNKGVDGRYYDMFMDESLEVDPSQMSDSMDHQMNLFTMTHENRYGEMMNELISIFIPPDNASAEELEEAKHNMAKYADYRTYLSFDMQQIIEGEETIRIRLSRMIKKNSGGEGQNPLYVALLASFAQAYRVGKALGQRNPTIRLVVLDEAFSKMDAEKVASCIALIRGLGFQAIISATNDKIQNYLENVDKTFVFANPNKKHISIQEFEKLEFGQLREDAE